MLLNLFSGDRNAIMSVLFCLPIVMFSLSFHEAAHGWAASKLGDPTARNLGRLTLNPIKHLDPIGFISMMIIGFGWAKPVPVNARNFDNPRVGMALTGVAGPASNFILALASILLYSISNVWYSFSIFTGSSEGLISFIYCLTIFFYLSSYMNLSLMAFNLIPVPPFDGSRFFYLLLPSSWYFKVMKHEQTIMIVILVGFILLSRIGLNPVSFVADGLFDLISTPLNKLFFGIANKML